MTAASCVAPTGSSAERDRCTADWQDLVRCHRHLDLHLLVIEFTVDCFVSGRVLHRFI